MLPSALLLIASSNAASGSYSYWDGSTFRNVSPIPADIRDGHGNQIAGAVVRVDGDLSRVSNPTPRQGFGHSATQLLCAVAAGTILLPNAADDLASILGLFAEPDGSDLHWERLGSVGASQVVNAVDALDGSTVYVSWIEWEKQNALPVWYLGPLVVGQVTPTNIPLDSPPLFPPFRVRVRSAKVGHVAYAIFGRAIARFNGVVDPTRWHVFAGPSNDSLVTGDADDAGNVFVATASSVWRGFGETGNIIFSEMRNGLPLQPFIADLLFARDNTAAGAIYIGTFGRSVWQRYL